MIAAQIVAHGDLEAAFERFGNGHALKLADKTIKIVAYRYRKSIRQQYLMGQMLGQRTGELSKSLVAGRKKGAPNKLVYLVGAKPLKQKDGTVSAGGVKLANIYEHAGGYTIVPKNRKALKFEVSGGTIVFAKKVVGRARPFMSQSSKEFDWPGTFAKTEEEVIGKELKKLAKEGIYVPGGLE